MGWLTNTLGSAIGKKLMMAVTGLGFIGFLKVHLAGNLTLYGGKDAFNSYAEHLHALGPLVNIFEVGLLTLALIHILTGLTLFLGNWRARPSRYIVNATAGGRSLGSRTMPYTGLIILLFVVYHLANFHFVDKTGTTIFNIVQGAFKNPVNIVIYIAAMIALADSCEPRLLEPISNHWCQPSQIYAGHSAHWVIVECGFRHRVWFFTRLRCLNGLTV